MELTIYQKTTLKREERIPGETDKKKKQLGLTGREGVGVMQKGFPVVAETTGTRRGYKDGGRTSRGRRTGKVQCSKRFMTEPDSLKKIRQAYWSLQGLNTH